MPASADRLQRTIENVGAAACADELAAAAADALRRAQAISDEEMGARFRKTRGYEDFCALLRASGAGAGTRVLALGCGARSLARAAAYPASVVREQVPGAAVEEWNWRGGAAGPDAGRGFDLVVTHSLVHYFRDYRPVCEWLRGMVRPGGQYLMANEPNARFRANPECVRGMERVSAAEARGRRFTKYLSPGRYLARVRGMLRGEPDEDAFTRAGRALRGEMGLHRNLTPEEIAVIVDPHLDGLNWEELPADALAGMRLAAVRTSGYVMRHNPARLPARWHGLQESLAARYPLDGCTVSALWRRL